MPSEIRVTNIEKVITKYSSNKYIDKEYRMGRFPSTDLFWVLYEYACEHCKRYHSNNDFVSEAYIIDDLYILERFDGQGSVININKIKNKELL